MQVVTNSVQADGSATVCRSKIHLIDLAGSEDNKRTGNHGVRMVESAAINKSLFVLGQVVDALNSNAQRVPYRDAKLTRYLQDSLGGSSVSGMVACVGMEQTCALDTFNTVTFAVKASNVRNTVVVNQTGIRSFM